LVAASGFSSAEVYDDGRHPVAKRKMATRNRRQEETAAKEAEETVVNMRVVTVDGGAETGR